MCSSSTLHVIKLIIAEVPGVTYQELLLQHHCKYQHNKKGKLLILIMKMFSTNRINETRGLVVIHAW